MAVPNIPGERAGNRLKPAGKRKPKVKARKSKRPVAPKPAPFDPSAPLTEDALNQTVQANTDLAFGGAEQALQGQIGVHHQMGRNIPAWYADYQNALAAATQRTGAGYAAALGAQQNTMQSTAALDEQQRAALTGVTQADAAARGATVDPALAGQAQQAASARQTMLSQYQGLTGTLGASEVGFRANREAVGAGQKLSALETEAQRGRTLGTAVTDLRRQKGASAAKTRQDLINLEHTKALENKAFGLNTVKAQLDAEADAARIAEQARGRRSRARAAAASRGVAEGRLTETQRHNRAQESLAARRAAGTGGLTPAQRRARQRDAQKMRTSVDTAAADAKTALSGRIPVRTPDGKVEVNEKGEPTQRTRKPTESEVRASIRKKYKDRDIANAAMDIAVNGYVSPVNQRRLKARGLSVPKSWLASRPKLKPTLPSHPR